MSTPFFFEEQKNTIYYHNIRVFICGADVTPWITTQLSIVKADRDGINSCHFTLSNAYRAFEITQDNLNGTWRPADPYLPDGRYSELAKYTIYQIKSDPAVNTPHEVQTYGPVKAQGELGGRVLVGQKNTRNVDQASSDVTTRYPFTVGSLIFHKYDPIRVFVLDPSDRDGRRWTCEFTGFLDNKPYTQDYISGHSQISISAQDIRMLMHSMRTQTNPSAKFGNKQALQFAQGGVVKNSGDAGFFNDLVPKFSVLSHVLGGGRSFKESIRFLLFGIGNNGSAGSGGVGDLSEGNDPIYSYDPKDPDRADTLEDWNNLVLFGQKQDFLTFEEMMTMGADTTPDGDAAPDSQYVYYLFPDQGAPNYALITASPDANVQARVDWSSRLDLLNQVCKGVDYQFYVTGIGDIVFEFPMYDFMPSDFNPTYNHLYTFEKHLISDDINDEGGTVCSALVVNSSSLRGEINQNNTTTGGNNLIAMSANHELTRTVFSNVLASRVGVHVETYTVPGITDQNRLTQLAMIEFNKRISNYNKFSIHTSYRPFVGVNRPIYHPIKARVGVSRSVTYTWKIREDVTISIDLAYVRKSEENGKFRSIAGGEHTPISYNTIYKDAFLQGQGFNVGGDGRGVIKTEVPGSTKSPAPGLTVTG